MPAGAGKSPQHRTGRRRFVEVHRLRIELGGEFANFIGRDVPRSETAQMARFKILKEQRVHGGGHLDGKPDCGRSLWQSQPNPRAWLALDLPEPLFGASHLSNET